MGDIWKDAGAILGTVAPVLATAVGGPLAGVAAKAIISALGLPADTPEPAVAAAVAGASADQLLALKKAEQDFAETMRKLEIDVLRIDADDRSNARAMQIANKSWEPGALGALVTIGFFAVLGYLVRYGLPKDQTGSEAILIMLGALGAAFGCVVNFFFGSSAGSAKKDSTIASMSAR